MIYDMDITNKIERSAKTIKVVISLLGILAGIVYSFCIFIYQSHQNAKDIADLRHEFTVEKTKIREELAKSNGAHKLLEEKIIQNQQDFKMTATKLDVSLVRISTDLQFIKEQLMRKGMVK